MSFKKSRAPDDQEIKGAVFTGQNGCEHQEGMQPIEVIHGTGKDAGTVAFQIGESCIYFNSTDALIKMLDRREGSEALTLAV